MKRCKNCGKADCYSLKGWACWNAKSPESFDEWYLAKIGITTEEAKRAGVSDMALLEEAWNFQPSTKTNS